MSNKYFSTQEAPTHPRIKFWTSRMQHASRTEVELYRSREGLIRGTPRLFVTFYGKGEEAPNVDEVTWELELDQWLISKGVRAVSVENEKERWSLHVTYAFRSIVNRYGEGYFSSVLIALLKKGPFAAHPEVSSMLAYVRENSPSPDSQKDCEDMIEAQFFKLAEEVKRLYPDTQQAEDVLGGAIGHCLDERYSISDRRQLGWLT